MKKNKDIILNKVRKYYINNKKLIKYYRESKTDEQKQKMKDYQKEYRKNMTDEQKQKIKDYQKEYRKKMTGEQKQKYKKAKYHNKKL